MALILGILFAIISSGLIVTGTLVLRAHRVKTETSFRLHGQATQFARAGMMEALGWFRKQTAQPVTAFSPLLDLTVTPQILDTLDPDVGIVREFSITGAVWGRYEVWKEWEGDPDSSRLEWRRKVQVEDVSIEKGAAGSGYVWRVRSIGYVYRLADASKSFDQYPNQILGTDILETEIRRMTLAPPGEAAICLKKGKKCTLDGKVTVSGITGAGVYYKSGKKPNELNGATVTGNPRFSKNKNDYDGSTEAVFGLSEDDLKSVADDRITALEDFPVPLPSNSLQFVELPSLTIDSARPLKGSAVLYVKGDLDVQYNSKSFFTGLIYVDGDVLIREPTELNGTIVATGTIDVIGSSDWVTITYDDVALGKLRTEIGQYRLSGAIRSVISTE